LLLEIRGERRHPGDHRNKRDGEACPLSDRQEAVRHEGGRRGLTSFLMNSAPWSKRRETISTKPEPQAEWRGVFPFYHWSEGAERERRDPVLDVDMLRAQEEGGHSGAAILKREMEWRESILGEGE
jgi:hypothetical protein